MSASHEFAYMTIPELRAVVQRAMDAAAAVLPPDTQILLVLAEPGRGSPLIGSNVNTDRSLALAVGTLISIARNKPEGETK